jgi:3-hydroxybutyrate dehydrogenase
MEKRFGVRTIFAGANLRFPAEIEQMMAEAEKTFGAVDILVNNAVVRHADPVEEFPVAKWDEGLAVNLSSAFHTIRLALPQMRRKNWGRIINVSSIYGLRGTVNRVAYVTTKTALIGLTRAVALEALGQNITCNALCPGTTQTPVHEARIQESMASAGWSRSDAERRFLSGKQPSGRFIQSADVASLMLFLCQPEARDITGAALPMDGGWSSY